MSDYPIPTLKEQIEQIEKSYDAKLSLDECPVEERKAEAMVLGYTANALYGFLQYQGKQIFAKSSNHENLLAHCAEIGVYPKLKTAAVGSVSVPGIIGSTLPQGAILTRGYDNRQYKVTNEVTFTSNPQIIKVEAVEKGVKGNAISGEILNFAKSWSGIENSATVILIGSGADDELDEDLTVRYHQTLQSIYHGGNDNDYAKWALLVEGVNQVWTYPCEMGVGTMTVRIMTPNGFPDAILCQKVVDYIDTVRPPTYNEFYVVSPIAKPINLAISSLSPNTDDMKAAIKLSLENSFKLNAAPNGEVLVSQLHSAILSTLGLKDYHLDNPNSNIKCGTGEIAVLGEITWI